MALIQSKQLNPKFTGSFIISGSKPSDGSFRTNLEVIGGLKSDSILVSSISASSNISGSGNLLIGGTSQLTGNVTAGGNLNVTGNVSASGFLYVSKSFDVDAKSNLQNDLNLIGHMTASGNISGSSSTTASFGKVQLSDDTHLNAGTFAISGSSVSTASFGMVKIHAIEGASPITFNDTIIENKNLEVIGQITASSHISASGNLSVTGNVDFDGNLDVTDIISLINSLFKDTKFFLLI